MTDTAKKPPRRQGGRGGATIDDVLLPFGRAPGGRRRAPVLVFGRWRLLMSEQEAARFESLIKAHCAELGSPFGLVGKLLRDL